MPTQAINKSLPQAHPTFVDFKMMLDVTNAHAAKCVEAAVEYNKTWWDKNHKEADFKIGDLVLLSTIKFNNLGGSRKLKPSFVGSFPIINLNGRNAVEVTLSTELSRRHPVFPVSLVKHYHDRGDKVSTPVIIPVAEPSDQTPNQIQSILKDKKEHIDGKDVRLYLVRYKGLSADKDEWLPETNIPDAAVHLRAYRSLKRNQ